MIKTLAGPALKAQSRSAKKQPCVATALFVAVLTSGLAGCLEQSEPGVYPGKPDQALEKQELKQLQDRAKLQR
ncbi:MAG: hypothetical protein AAFV69_03245 [Pseudomonadota bacterium]